MSALDEPVAKVEPRRTVYAANKADLDDLLRHALAHGEAVLYAPSEGLVELVPDPGKRGEAPEHDDRSNQRADPPRP